MELKFKTLEEVWKTHKELLRASDNSHEISWRRKLPEEAEATKLLAKRERMLLIPPEPIYLSLDKLNDTVRKLKPQVEQVWEHSIKEMPTLELVNSEDFLPQVGFHQAKINGALGLSSALRSVPMAYLATTDKTLIFPKRLVLRAQRKDEPVSADNGEKTQPNSGITTVLWDNTNLEVTVSEKLSYLVFRQARREWGENYLKTMIAVGPENQATISRIAKVSSLLANERLSTQYHPKWGFYVATDAITNIWKNRRGRQDYVGLDALSQTMSLVRSSMVDNIEFNVKGEIVTTFLPAHPYRTIKEGAFGKAKKSE